MDKTKELINKANIFFEILSENMTKEKKSEWFIVSACFRLLFGLINAIFVGIGVLH